MEHSGSDMRTKFISGRRVSVPAIHVKVKTNATKATRTTPVRRQWTSLSVYCGPVLRHAAEPTQAANCRSSTAS